MSPHTKKVLQAIGTGVLYVGALMLESWIDSKIGDCENGGGHGGQGHHHHHHH
jgi:hypothetical protein